MQVLEDPGLQNARINEPRKNEIHVVRKFVAGSGPALLLFQPIRMLLDNISSSSGGETIVEELIEDE